jgi:hypothetical protein
MSTRPGSTAAATEEAAGELPFDGEPPFDEEPPDGNVNPDDPDPSDGVVCEAPLIAGVWRHTAYPTPRPINMAATTTNVVTATMRDRRVAGGSEEPPAPTGCQVNP